MLLICTMRRLRRGAQIACRRQHRCRIARHAIDRIARPRDRRGDGGGIAGIADADCRIAGRRPARRSDRTQPVARREMLHHAPADETVGTDDDNGLVLIAQGHGMILRKPSDGRRDRRRNSELNRVRLLLSAVLRDVHAVTAKIFAANRPYCGSTPAIACRSLTPVTPDGREIDKSQLRGHGFLRRTGAG
jgi:hypothetical protein